MTANAGVLSCTEVARRLQSAVPTAVNFVGCEGAEEVIQDGTAMAAKMMHNAEHAGKKVTPAATSRRGEISAGNIAYFTIVKLRNWCRSSGMVTGDVYGAGTQINGRTRLTSLDDVAARDEESGGEIFLLHDVLADGGEDPATKATRKLDWETFCAGLSERERAVIQFIVEGRSLRDAAHALRVSDSAVQHSKRNVAVKILEFMGFDIPVEIQRRPQWKQNLETIRERMACREERRC